MARLVGHGSHCVGEGSVSPRRGSRSRWLQVLAGPNGRGAVSPLELLVEVLLAAVPDTERDRFDLDAFVDQGCGMLQPHTRQIVANARARFLPEETTEVRRLPPDTCRQAPKRDDVRVIGFDRR